MSPLVAQMLAEWPTTFRLVSGALHEMEPTSDLDKEVKNLSPDKSWEPGENQPLFC